MDAAESPVGVKDRESVGEWRFVLAIYVNRYRCGFNIMPWNGEREQRAGNRRPGFKRLYTEKPGMLLAGGERDACTSWM